MYNTFVFYKRIFWYEQKGDFHWHLRPISIYGLTPIPKSIRIVSAQTIIIIELDSCFLLLLLPA